MITNPADAELGPSPLSQEDERNDAINALQEAGMEPMETAPKTAATEITVVLEGSLKKERVFWQDDFFGGGCWVNVEGHGAPDSPPWPHWDAEELLGWLPEGTT